jgi:hypothetical protein
MFAKNKLFGLIVVATAALPYVMSTLGGIKGISARFWPSAPADGTTAQVATTDPKAAPTHVAEFGASGVPHEGGAVKIASAQKQQVVHPLEEVLRFEVTTNWILATWPRVSASLAELDVQGYRVPLVSGTTDADIAGSLTYYFNKKQRVERITFFGTTGDARRLVALLESRFSFKRAVTPEPNLFVYQVKSWGKVTSEMRIRPAPIVRSEIPYARFEVALLIDRPSSMD